MRFLKYLLLTTLSLASVSAQMPFDGNTLISPLNSSRTILIDMDGNTIQTWQGASQPGQMAYLLDDYSILRSCSVFNSTFHAGGSGGRIQLITADGDVTWDFTYSTSEYIQHHDIHPMPNGNILLVCS